MSSFLTLTLDLVEIQIQNSNEQITQQNYNNIKNIFAAKIKYKDKDEENEERLKNE